MPRAKTTPTIANRVPPPARSGGAPAPGDALAAQRQALRRNPEAPGGSAQSRVLDRHPALVERHATLATSREVAMGAQAGASANGPAGEPPFELADAPGKLRALSDAVTHAVDMWKIMAGFRNVRIQGPTAIGTPGCLDGPELAPHVRTAPSVVGWIDDEADLRDAVAEGVSGCFRTWQDSVMVPGLPWYPAFAAWPGPAAPPMPNVPSPLVALPGFGEAMITVPGNLESALIARLPDGLRVPAVERLMNALSLVLSLAFNTWLVSSQVMLVMGQGPVPTFAPPMVPVGPVMNGTIIPSAGHLATAPSLAPVAAIGLALLE